MVKGLHNNDGAHNIKMNKFKINKRTISLLYSLFFCSICNASNQSALTTYPVTIKNCPTTLKLTIPKEFTKASKANAIKLRASILSAINKPYKEQPYSKAKAYYSEVYKTDWSNDWPPFPRIQISSLGSVQKSQGKISVDTWRAIKNATINVDKIEQRKRFKKISEYYKGYGVDVDVVWMKPYEKDTNTIVLNAIGQTNIPNDNKVLNYIGATKMIYAHKCVAAVSVYVDLKTPKAFSVLDNYVNNISVK